MLLRGRVQCCAIHYSVNMHQAHFAVLFFELLVRGLYEKAEKRK